MSTQEARAEERCRDIARMVSERGWKDELEAEARLIVTRALAMARIEARAKQRGKEWLTTKSQR
jgi:hypothetical protein